MQRRLYVDRTFSDLVRAEMDATGLDEVTAARIVSQRLHERGKLPTPHVYAR